MVDSVARAMASAGADEEPIPQVQSDALDHSEEWIQQNEPLAYEENLAGFGLTASDSPLKQNGA